MDAIVEVGMTLNYVLDASCAKFAELPAIGMAMEEPLTYAVLQKRVFALAAYFLKLGVQKGDRIAILSENSHNWGIAYLAIVRIGAIAVPILPDLPESDVHHILNEMQAKVLLLSQKQIDKVYELDSNLPATVITLDDYSPGGGSTISVVAFSDCMEQALADLDEDPTDPAFPAVGEEDLASILYTSGTSGYSKAVMLTHKNLTANAYSAVELVDVPTGAVWLSILPISHTYEFTCGFIVPLLCGARIAYAGKTPTPLILQNICAREKPTIIFAVPLVMEKIYKKRVLPQIENSVVLKMLCRFGASRRMIYRKIGRKLQSFFGGNLRLMGIGGAALNPDVEKFLHEAGFPYLIGYGMTEVSPLIAGGPAGDKSIVVGSTGKPVPGLEVKIVDPDPQTGIGEITVCGPSVMKGYYDDEEETRAVLSADGWLSTGDMGYMDKRQNLVVCGRSKNVIVMPNGENVYPEAIEHTINKYSWVVESLVLENCGLLEAWVYPDYDVLDESLARTSHNERRRYIDELFEETRIELNQQLPKTARLNKLLERREPFIKTATHKIKRYLYSEHPLAG
ncbi:MAG: long-chain fatty acid--CoA ligase [Deltaproteobacteria bacterium]|nr:MAG: long-chain fatty acid--CoA ligase [Deltaproteobacteria bacterium]